MTPIVIVAISASAIIIASAVIAIFNSTVKFIFRKRKSTRLTDLKKEHKQNKKELKKLK